MDVILDTDFLINIAKYKIDLLEECRRVFYKPFRLMIIDKTIDELKGKPEEKLVLQIIKRNNIEMIKTEKNKIVDDLIMENLKEDIVIATQDKELKQRVKKKGLKTLLVRQKKYLELI